MNGIKDVKAGENSNNYQNIVVISETDSNPISILENNGINSFINADLKSDELNYITISNDGFEAEYHKGGLIFGVLVIFLLGVLVGALVF